ncbi:MAG: hypothetical protein JHD16_05325 [Solirubrobacteraceae bacterium]|nr:hypothetical protein [Solirubrobacteraceae bacterium]
MGAVSLMLVSTAVAVQSVGADQDVGRKDRDRKAAYSAAEAGLQVYVHRLLNDNTYWAQCDGVAGDGINQPWKKPAPGPNPPVDPRDWQPLPDNSAQWTTEVLPVADKPKCDVNDPEGTMVDPGTPTFRIRVTGQALVNAKPTGPKRSLIATFKRKSFLDYIYFTDLEAQDPSIYVSSITKGWDSRERPGENPSPTEPGKQRNISEWGNVACSQYTYVKAVANRSDGEQFRVNQKFKFTTPTSGRRERGSTGSWSSFAGNNCTEITFADSDWIQGPMHTNDIPQICGRPRFGRSPADVIEISGPGDTAETDERKSWRVSSQNGCSGSTPDVNFEDDTNPRDDVGTWKFNQKLLKLPSSNLSLKQEAPPNYTFKGRTYLRLNSGSITVTGKTAAGQVYNNQSIAYPENGVIYVDNEVCTKTYDPMDADDLEDRKGCGIAVVRGQYNTSLTIAAADDIVLDGNIIRPDGAPAVLGLVSNNFIRLNHPVADQAACARGDNSSNATGWLNNPRIDAALLALKHSFLVDNWACGAPMGTLTVNGAIAQKYRGPVGTGSGKAMASGYFKLYKYDDRLRVRVPPKFIDPVESAWGIQSYQEQAPAQ